MKFRVGGVCRSAYRFGAIDELTVEGGEFVVIVCLVVQTEGFFFHGNGVVFRQKNIRTDFICASFGNGGG